MICLRKRYVTDELASAIGKWNHLLAQPHTRMTRRSSVAGLPAEEGNVVYTISMRACQPLLIVTSPADGSISF
jgi:hypothetical protein